MKINNYKLLFSILFIGILSVSYCQEVKFGKISSDDFKISKCPIDTGAHAYYITDYGYTVFNHADVKVDLDHAIGYDDSKGFQIDFDHFFRIKIVDKIGVENANIEIPLYSFGKNKEVLSGIKTMTYNLENGKVVKTKYDNESFYTERKDVNTEIVKIAIPNVKEGSIIDVKYTIRTDFLYNLHGWKFQKKIPVLSSLYEVNIPEYYKYNEYLDGSIPVKKEVNSSTKSFTVTYYKQVVSDLGSPFEKYSKSIDYFENKFRFSADSIPAFISDVHLTTSDNYISKLEYELSSTRFPNSPIESFSFSWQTTVDQLTDYDFFGKQLLRSDFTKKDADVLKMNSSGKKLIYDGFNFIKNKYKWNGMYSSVSSSNLPELYKNWTGNSADINLTLIQLLKELGFNAYPVVVSTRNNGKIYNNRSTISGFNHVIAQVKYEGESFLMDATSPSSEVNLLPVACLNGNGLMIDKKVGDLIPINNNKAFKRQSKYDLELLDNGKFIGILNEINTDYAKLEELRIGKNKTERVQDIEKNNTGLHIDSVMCFDVDSTNKLIKQFKITIQNQSSVMNDLISFKPLLYSKITENPFKLKNRNYPVEMPYSSMDVASVKIKIPKGFIVESLPKSTTIALPDNAGRFSFSMSEEDGIITINRILNLSKTFYTVEEFKGLYDFYNLMVDKSNEEVLLKKKL